MATSHVNPSLSSVLHFFHRQQGEGSLGENNLILEGGKVLYLMAASPKCPGERSVPGGIFRTEVALQRAAFNSLLPLDQLVSTSQPSRCGLPGYHLLNLCFLCFT